jgi:DNA-binding GntR family transcriptional regulator
MALDFAPPRYAQLVTAIQDRIDSCAYAPGAVMPTEAQLATEFDVSRATVVRALQLLKAEGWVESRQGRGTFVRGRPAAPAPAAARRGSDALNLAETGGPVAVEIQHSGPTKPPAAVAAALGLPDGAEAFLRRRLLSAAGEPVELVSAWFPTDVADGTALSSPAPLAEGTAEHLRRGKGISTVRVTERITARMPTAEETRILAMPRRVPVLDLLVTAYDSDGRAVQAVAVVLPADRHELEDTYLP